MTGIVGFAQRAIFGLSMLLVTTAALCGQEAPAGGLSATEHVGIPEDWSTQRVIYTRNGSVEDMMKVRHDPRFLTSFLLHNMREHRNQVADVSGNERIEPNSSSNAQDSPALQMPLRFPSPPRRNKNSKIDWAVDLGPTYGMAIGETPAKYVFDPNATPTCNDFVVFSLKAPAAVGSQANLVALKNLYSGSPVGPCGAAPTFMFSYAIGSGRSYLSPVLSIDGKKVAWIETSSANHAILHVTKWFTGEGTNATTGAVGIASGGSCVAGGSCDVAIDYTNSAYPGCSASVNSNTNSELYVDYPSDTGFVGADNGILYHIKGIFRGTPTVDFCIPVNTTAGVAMSGGVYDSLLSPPVFFISDSKTIWAYTVGASSFTLKTSVTYGSGTLTGPGPILDAFNNFIYIFSANDIGTPTHHTSMTQLPTSLASSVVVPLGPASANAYPILFYGAYDNNYFNNGPFSASSTLYSCGTDSTTTTAQDLFAISFNPSTGLANTTPVMAANKNVNPGGLNGTCSPITEFFDGTTDRLFIGMGQHLATTGANVVTMWDVTTQLNNANTKPKATASNYLGGSSGIVIDNNATGTTQAASIYFTTLAANGTSPGICGANRYCAVKLTQGLQ